MGSARSRPRQRRRKRRHSRGLPEASPEGIGVENTVAPFGDVSAWGAPTPSEMPMGWRWYGGFLQLINWRRAAVALAAGAVVVFVIVVIGAAVTD